MLNGLDLFSGIGGLTIALVKWVNPIAYCESDRFAQGVILSRIATGGLPWAPIWDNVTTLEGKGLRGAIDIIYGGFPCQDISFAGPGAGLEGERSGLVFEMLRLVGEIHPQFIFMENVPAIRTRGAERIGKELAARGYDQRWCVVSAREMGAPHLRKRWFLLANSNRKGLSFTGRDGVETRMESGHESEFSVQKKIWQQSPSDIHRMDDGISPKTHRIRALGNAVVPQQAREAFKRLMGII